MTKPVLQIVIGSTRPGRRGLAVGRWAADFARTHGGFEVEVVDLAELNLPIFDEAEHPRLGRYAGAHTKAWASIVGRADAFLFVIPEYNHSFSAAVKNALDYLSAEWANKPIAFVSYGGVAGGTRAVQALKPVLVALHLVPIMEGVPIPFVDSHLVDGEFVSNDALDGGAKVVLDELLAWTATLAARREN